MSRPVFRKQEARLGSFDHLVFTAGETLQLGNLATTDVDAARRFLRTTLLGAFCAAKYGSRNIREGGSIVLPGGVRWLAGHSVQVSAPPWRD
jgi:NAD(P)-dependent dehydrogenase (short-subunit alcohol dehydrogenase family)